MRKLPARATQIALSVLALSALSACIDEEAIYADKDLFTDPPTAAASFLGYTNPETRLTACGGCHIEKQGQWAATGHAEAWSTLESTDETSCETCHSTNALGNYVVGEAGHTATGDARYQDVQCESCHGPGLEHGLDPRPGTIPLASMLAGAELTTGCGECHQGWHQPFVEEWAASRHGSINVFPAGQGPQCDKCHTGEGALESWGVDVQYIEKATLSEPGNHMAITCAVCHDPHGGPNYAALRFPINVPSFDRHLCMKCHQERATPDPSNERGPHAPEGPTLLGHAGWVPPNWTWSGQLVGTHGDPEANPRLCATCHVASFEVGSPVVFRATGHLFRPIPCLDGTGKPTAETDCDDSQRTFAACTGSGCHGTEAEAQAARIDAVDRIQALANELRELLDDVPGSEFDGQDNRYTVGEGARFNVTLGEYTGSAIHNPFLIEALLLGSIDAVEATYGLMASPGLSRTPLFTLD